MQTPMILRPVFTRRLAQRLQAGGAINVIGTDAQGASRLLVDLMRIAPDNVRVLLADMQLFGQDYPGFMAEISQQLGFESPAESLDELVEAFQVHGGTFWLLINHLDLIWQREDVHPGYDAAFWESLKRFWLSPSLALLAVSDQPLEVHIADMEAFVMTDGLDFDPRPLPPLNFKRIRESLETTIPGLQDSMAWANEIFSHPYPYPYLTYIQDQMQRHPMPDHRYSLRLMNTWREAFEQIQARELPDKSSPASWWQHIRNWFNT
jgi:hypothetical protein